MSGSATRYSISWSPSTPDWINVNQPAGSSTITLSGTSPDNISSTESYTYVITAQGDECIADPSKGGVVTGTITITPGQYINKSNAANLNQTICDNSLPIDPIQFTLTGSSDSYNVSWTSGQIGLGIVNTSTNTFVISGTVNITGGITQTTIFPYLISTRSSISTCESDTISGEIRVIPQLSHTINTPLTQYQRGTICNDGAIEPIIFSVIGGDQSAKVSLTWTSANELPNVEISSDPTNTVWTISGATDDSITSITYYPYQVTIYRDGEGACVNSDSFTGEIIVSPRPFIDRDFILQNDLTHVSCPGGSDGSIIIPSTPSSEFIKRITGGQYVVAQIDNVSISASDTLDAGDVVGIILNSSSISITVANGRTSTATILEDLAVQVNLEQNQVTAQLIGAASTSPSINLTTNTPGVSFTSLGTTISSNVTGTSISTNTTSNVTLEYSYVWRLGNVTQTTSLSLENVTAGSYDFEVYVNGCSSGVYNFIIDEPTLSVGTTSFTCNGGLSIPVDAYFTTTQMAIPGLTIRAEIYELANDGTYTQNLYNQSFNVNSASSTYIFDFNGGTLIEGELYKVTITDNFCNGLISDMIGPIDAEIDLDENQIVITDEECIGEGGTITVPNGAITGGSGNYSFSWRNLDDGKTYITKNVVGASDGTYTLTITDQQDNCTYILQNNIVILPAGNILNATWVSNTNVTQNLCADGRLGRLEILPDGINDSNYSYRWFFTPAITSSVTISNTIEINNNSNLLLPGSVPEIPNSMSTTGRYRVLIYEASIADNCAVIEENISITGPSPVSMVSTATFTNIVCAGENNGSIEFTVTGGIPPYFYSLSGGIPSSPLSSGANSHIEQNLPPGQYNILIKDSSPDQCNSVAIAQNIIITEPSGGPLELSEGTITAIPCISDGFGSFEVNISGGSNQKLLTGTVSSGSTNFITNDIYQVRVVGPENFKFNTSFNNNSNSSILVERISNEGQYTVTVTDGSGNCSKEITITINNEAAENLAATARGIDSSDCSSDDPESSGGTIEITQFSKGDGEISGYPLWQRLTSNEFDKFIISLNGTVDNVNLADIGIVIGGIASETINASGSSTSSITSVSDVAARLADNINNKPNYSATLNGSTITVLGEIIDIVNEIGSTSSTLNISVSNITKTTKSSFVSIPGLEGLEKIENLQAGIYRGIIKDGSGCGETLVQNIEGGSRFIINDPQSLQFEDIIFSEISCSKDSASLEFRLSNGAFVLVPDAGIFELSLNSNILKSTSGSISFNQTTSSASGTTQSSSPTTSSSSSTSSAQTVGNSYSPNFNTNKIKIEDLSAGDYELTVTNKQTQCVAALTFTIEDPVNITYSGDTEFEIDPCYETFQDIFFDQNLIDGGTPFKNLQGESYYSLRWKYFPIDPSRSVKTINILSNNVNFKPEAGRYELYIRDLNGCKFIDESGSETAIEFIFSKEINSLVVNGTGGTEGNLLSQPVSCQIDAEDGQINIEILSANPNEEVPPFDIKWEKQTSNNISNEQRLLIEGSVAGDSLEVYTIRLNEIPLSYTTKIENEPKENVISELILEINNTSNGLFDAGINPNNEFEIIIQTVSGAKLELEIVSRNTRLQMIRSTSNIAVWSPLDGTNGNPNYNGYLDLDNLGEGSYRYTITSANNPICDNNTEPDSLQGVITVENENILEIREGPIVDEYLCNGKSGSIFIDIFDGDTGPLTFFYNSTPITYELVGTNQYLLNIDNPVEKATLEIYNSANCGLSREISIGNGTPLFDFNSTNFLQSGTYLAREDITFTDLSENEYDSFEFFFGDGTQSELLERNSPEPIIHEYAISGTYYVTLRIYNDLGCIEELNKTIKIGKGYSILVPNVFTPNGDIWNSTFRPVFNGLSEITLRIYDAQGGLLYEEAGSDGADPDIVGLSLRGWEGTNLPSSPYFIYTIRAKTIDDEPVFRDGTFILLQ